jgi:UPF0271 protein
MKKVYVFDTSALILYHGPLEGLTVKEVLAEAKSSLAKLRGSLVRVQEPSISSLDEVSKLAKKTGDVLSETDLKLLALALDLKKEGKVPQILTDDYSIQNLASVLGIEFSGVGEKGIKRVLKWVTFCPFCGKSFPASESECKFCGSPLKRKPTKYTRPRGY